MHGLGILRSRGQRSPRYAPTHERRSPTQIDPVPVGDRLAVMPGVVIGHFRSLSYSRIDSICSTLTDTLYPLSDTVSDCQKRADQFLRRMDNAWLDQGKVTVVVLDRILPVPKRDSPIPGHKLRHPCTLTISHVREHFDGKQVFPDHDVPFLSLSSEGVGWDGKGLEPCTRLQSWR